MKVYIGIPMYGGADAQFVSSLLKTRVVLDRLGYEVEVDINNGCSVLTKARNDIVKRFIDSGFDVLFFLDSDMVWDVIDMVKLLRSGRDFSACIYRSKSEDINYHCVTDDSSGEWIKAERVGTGFMCLSRECLLKMVEAYPETKYLDGQEKHALFDFQIHDGQYWGEDYTFCRRWREIGGEIDVLTDATLYHIGTKTYEGNYSAHMKGAENV